MPRDTTIRTPGYIFLPQKQYRVSWKVQITNGSTVTDVTGYVISLNIDWNLGRLATCNIVLTNPKGKWLNKWDGGETVDVYGEYQDVTPTNKLFSGKIDNPYFTFGSDGYKMVIECRQAPELADKKVIEQFDNATVDDAIKTVIDNNYSGIVTYTNVNSTTETYTGNFQHVSGIDVLNTLANKAGMDLYIDTDGDIHLFEKESINNSTESVTFNNNLIAVSKFGKDTAKIFNRVIVYGKEENNIVLLKTEEDTASQTDLWVKDLIEQANSIDSMAEIQEKANIVLTNNTNIEEDGAISSLGLPTITPGDNLMMQIPYCGIEGYKNIRGFSHSLSPSGFFTNLQIKDIQDTTAEIFRERIEAEDRLKVFGNLNAMTDSYTVYFNEDPDIVTLTNTEIVDETVKLKSGETSGTCILDMMDTDNTITKCELRISTNFPNQELCTFDVTNDGGDTYERISPGSLHTFLSTGSKLALRINFIKDSTHDPVFDSVCLLYK